MSMRWLALISRLRVELNPSIAFLFSPDASLRAGLVLLCGEQPRSESPPLFSKGFVFAALRVGESVGVIRVRLLQQA
ncbi:hypothetical protein EMGBS1_03680 [Chloroflexota bacterium]|nr:hypothetical protein EMGBS1_03680 [Chloroflexota bacterium]